MIEKRAVFADTRILADGTLEVRLDKQIVEDGKVIWREPHRTTIQPGEDADAVMAGVLAHLGSGVALAGGDVVPFPVADKSADRVKAIAAVEHTPAVVARWKEKREKEERERTALGKK